MNNKENDTYIIEDVLYYKMVGKDYVSTAKDTFFYKIMTDTGVFSKQPNSCQHSATVFLAYQKIYTAMANLGILTNPDYCLSFNRVDGSATFSFNISKAKEELDLESLLIDSIDDKTLENFIHRLCHPVPEMRCSICGSVTLSFSHNFKDGITGKSARICQACLAIPHHVQNNVYDKYQVYGTLPAVTERLNYIRGELKEFELERNMNDMIDDFIIDNFSVDEDARVDIIDQILRDEKRDDLDVFNYNNHDIAIINRCELQNIETFKKVFKLSKNSERIIGVNPCPDVSYINDDAIQFAIKLTNNNSLMQLLNKLNN